MLTNEQINDRVRVMEYIRSTKSSVVLVEDVARFSGADPFRVAPLLYQLYLEGVLGAFELSFWGVPVSYTFKKSKK